MLSALYQHFERFFLNSWWVLMFMLGCYVCYEQGLRQRDHDFNKLYAQYLNLQKEQKIAANLQEDLLLQINSQSDPDYVELTLMKGLGLVSEGQTKVFFQNNL